MFMPKLEYGIHCAENDSESQGIAVKLLPQIICMISQ